MGSPSESSTRPETCAPCHLGGRSPSRLGEVGDALGGRHPIDLQRLEIGVLRQRFHLHPVPARRDITDPERAASIHRAPSHPQVPHKKPLRLQLDRALRRRRPRRFTLHFHAARQLQRGQEHQFHIGNLRILQLPFHAPAHQLRLAIVVLRHHPVEAGLQSVKAKLAIRADTRPPAREHLLRAFAGPHADESPRRALGEPAHHSADRQALLLPRQPYLDAAGILSGHRFHYRSPLLVDGGGIERRAVNRFGRAVAPDLRPFLGTARITQCGLHIVLARRHHQAELAAVVRPQIGNRSQNNRRTARRRRHGLHPHALHRIAGFIHHPPRDHRPRRHLQLIAGQVLAGLDREIRNASLRLHIQKPREFRAQDVRARADGGDRKVPRAIAHRPVGPAYPGETPPHQPHMHVAQWFTGHGMNRRSLQTSLLRAHAGGNHQNYDRAFHFLRL